MTGISTKDDGGHKALSVTQLLRRMKMLLELEIGEVWIEGEVSNLRKQSSGHWYFSLKDDGAQISCAMFGASRRVGAGVLQDGAKVRVFAEASVYEARGQLQVIVMQVVAAGAGDLQARFEALKRKLQLEGLFEASRKKPIPKYPKVIGLITSGSGAALQDILNVMRRRAPWVQPVLYPVRVQGKGAEFEIAEAVRRMGRPDAFGLPSCDVLIVGRGGGSIEDLWNFNEEVVARAIADCPLPVISAVGHEVDFTIADFVADLRAPTPSAAAELAVADGEELMARMRHLGQRMRRLLDGRLERGRLVLDGFRRGMFGRGGERLLREPTMRLDAIRQGIQQSLRGALDDRSARLAELKVACRAHHPARVLARWQQSLSLLERRFGRAASDGLEVRRRRLRRLADMLRALGPESAFQRGFSITLGSDGKVVRSAAGLEAGDRLVTLFGDGSVRSRVTGEDSD